MLNREDQNHPRTATSSGLGAPGALVLYLQWPTQRQALATTFTNGGISAHPRSATLRTLPPYGVVVAQTGALIAFAHCADPSAVGSSNKIQ